MDLLTLPPDQEAYSVKDAEQSIAVLLDGGFPRIRADVEGAVSLLNVAWTIGLSNYQYLRAFYKSTTKRGSLPFEIDLVMDQPTLTRHTAYFVPGSMTLNSQRGLTYSVSAQLWVKPLEDDQDYLDTIVFLRNTYGECYSEVLNELNILVNQKLAQIKQN